jgi:purine catabolism regulator
MQLADVLRRFGLNLAQELESLEGRDRSVVGAHVLEVPNPLRYVPPEWILLSTGMRLFRKPAAQRLFIAELAEGGIAALGFGVGVAFDRPPSALMEEARTRDFPVFVVPEEMPFRDIIRFVDAQRLGHDLHALRRSITIHDRLLAAITQSDPEPAVTTRLARMLRCKVSLFDSFGSVVTTSDSSATQRQWNQLKAIDVGASGSDVYRRDGLFAASIAVDGVTLQWLVATTNDTSLEELVVERSIREATALLTTFQTLHRSRERSLTRQRSELLLATIDVSVDVFKSKEPISVLVARGRELSVDLQSPGRIVALLPRGAVDLDAASDALETHLSQLRLPSLLARREGRLLLRVPVDFPVSSLLQVDQIRGWSIGAGRAALGVQDLRRSFLDAELAVKEAQRNGPGSFVEQSTMRLVSWLLAQADPDDARARAAEVMKPLAGHSDLMATLRTYFASEMSVSDTARTLHLHKNSLRYRLRRIEHLMSRDLHDPLDVAELQLSLVVLDLPRHDEPDHDHERR